MLRGETLAMAAATAMLLGLAALRKRRGWREDASGAVVVRPIREEDRATWMQLWQGYVGFFGMTLDEEITNATWRRIMDGNHDLNCVVAERVGGQVVGFATFLVTPNTWSIQPGVYLEDLFVCKNMRGQGIGAKLILHLRDMCISQNYSRLFWVTEEDNLVAQALYNRVGYRTPYIQYRVQL